MPLHDQADQHNASGHMKHMNQHTDFFTKWSGYQSIPRILTLYFVGHFSFGYSYLRAVMSAL